MENTSTVRTALALIFTAVIAGCMGGDELGVRTDALATPRPSDFEPIVATTAVGTMPGSASVSPDGLFGYSVPIELPPGRAGMQPMLSVSYTSTEVETALGVGFALSGLSAITRCQRTVAQDGERRDVDLTPDDRLCLDGARLVLVSGSYGAVDARYTTEEDELVLVEAYGSASVPSFRVRLPNGRERQYGSTLDSRLWVTAPITGEIVTETWYLAQEVDPQGNSIDYEYQQEASADSTIRNDVRINRIEYTGNLGSGAGPIRGARAVQFVYRESSRHPPVGDCSTPPTDPGVSTSAFCSDSSPPSTAYARGIGAYRPSRLPMERLIISIKGEVVAEYRFRGSDAPGSHLYRLNEIEHCVRAPATSAADADEADPAMVCTPPTRFTWRDRAIVPRPNTADGEADPRYHLPTFERRDISWDRAELRGSFRCGTDDETGAPLYCSYPNPTLAFDVNGDGADDVAYRSDGTAPGASEGDLVVRLGLPIPRATANWPSGALPYEHTIVPAIRSEIPEFVDLVEGIRHGAFAIERPVALDWNADGLDDLLIEFGTADEVRFLVLESERGTPGTPVSFVLRDTTLREPREQIFFNDFPAVESGIASWEVLDMDGDGRQDIAACVIDVGCVQRSFSWDTRFTACPAHWAVALRDDGGWRAFQHSNVVTECSFENGRGRVQLYDFDSGSDPSPYTGRVVSGDFNGDGRQELIIAANYFDGGFRRVLRWSGSELIAEQMSSLPSFGVLTVADVNGDGMHDVTAVLSISHSYGADVNRPLSSIHISTGTEFIHSDFEIPLPGRRRVRLRSDGVSDRRVRTVLPLLPFDINRDGRADFITPTLGMDETLIHRVPGTPDTYPQYTWGEEGVWISEVLSGTEFQTYPTNASLVRTEYLEAGGGSVPTLITRDDLVLDADGDGALDLLDLERRGHPVGLIPAGGVGRLFHNIRGQAPLVERVVDGMGVVTEVDYRNLSDPAVYTPGTDCQYPQRCVTDSREVVYERRDDDGLGGQRTTRFSYVDGRADLSGRGWLGFARVRSVDLLSGTTSLTDFDNGLWSAMRDGPRIRYPRAHRPLHSLSYTYDASVTDSVVLQGAERYMSYLVTEPEAGRFRVRNDSVVEFAYEGMSAPTNPDAPFVGATMIRQVTTERSHYDVYGFPWVETSDAPGGQTTVETSWDHDAVAWRFGFVQRRTATAATPGLGGCARRVVEEFVNDLPAARVLSATRNPGDPLTTRVTQFGFDSYGNITETLTTAMDEDGEAETRVQTVLWDSNGYFPVTVINALGHVTTVAFEPRYGQLRASVDPNWIETRSYIDGFGRPRVAESDRGVRTEAHYLRENGGRFRIEVSSNAGGRAAVETDRLGRTVRAETVHATVTSEVVTVYDARGRVARVSEPGELGSGGGHPTTYFYDGLDRLRRTVSPEGEEVRFAYEPNRVHRWNAAGAEWTTTTDLLGHVVSATEPHESGAGPVATTGYGRCAGGEPAWVLDPAGNVTTVRYDLLGRRTKLSDPDSGGQYFEYDGWDELTATVDGENRRTRFVRDALSRLVARHDEADGALAEWEYDTASLGDRSALGLLAFSSSGDGVTDEFRYDELARPRSVTRRLTDFESRMDLVHHYDEFSRLVGVDYPSITGAGVHVDYQFDEESGEVTSVSRDEGGWSTRLWELAGQDPHGLAMKEAVGPASRGTTYRRDGRVATVETGSDEGVLQRLSYGYDERGMLRWRTDSLSARTEVFAHDALGRLFAVREGGHTTESYDYDLLGNLTGSHDAALSYPAGSGVARPHGVTDFDAATGETWTAQYDETGNVTEMGPLHLTWNQRNLPRTASNGGTYASFQYDADGGRALKVAGPETTVYFGAYEVRRVGMSLIERTVISTPVGPVAQIEVASLGSTREETTRWIFTERQGSVETSWVEGEDPEHFRYDAFGGVLSESGEVSGDAPSESVSHGYTGHEHDEALGFINMGGRIYHPRLRRFLSTDPLTSGSGQGLNRYSYVRNSPMMMVDPTGYDAAEVAAGNRAAYAEAQAALGWGCIGAVECSAAPSLAEPSGAGDTEASDGAGADRAGGALTGEGVASSAENAFMSGARGMGLAEPINLLAGGAGVATGFLGNVLLVGLAGAGVGLAGPQAVPYLIAVGSVALVVASIYTYQHRAEIWESISRPFSTIAAGEGNPSDFFHAGVTVGTVASLPVAGATFAPTRAAGAQIGEFLLPMAIDMTTTVGEAAAAGSVATGVGTLASTGGSGGVEAGAVFFHGTDIASARGLLAGAGLDASVAAASKIDGSAGFFLATHAEDAAYFALRRGAGGVLEFRFSPLAAQQLGGLSTSPIGALGRFGWFLGGETVIPTESFGAFNALRLSGDIIVVPH